MDDISKFGEVFHQLNFSEAIEKELLSDYQVVIVGVDDASVQEKIIDREIVQTDNELDHRYRNTRESYCSCKGN